MLPRLPAFHRYEALFDRIDTKKKALQGDCTDGRRRTARAEDDVGRPFDTVQFHGHVTRILDVASTIGGAGGAEMRIREKKTPPPPPFPPSFPPPCRGEKAGRPGSASSQHGVIP